MENIASKISLLGDSPNASLKQDVPLDQASQNNGESQPTIPSSSIEININPNGQNVIVETLVNSILTPLENPINVIVTDSSSNSIHIDEVYTSKSNNIELSSIPALSVAFSQSQDIVDYNNDILDLQAEYDSLPNTSAYNINRKSQIKTEIQNN